MTRDNAVWRMPFMKDGSVSKVGRFCSTFGPSGPDGMTMDKAGRLFVAHASLGHVFVFAPNGECIARIKSCAGQSCTNVAIGGDNARSALHHGIGDRHGAGGGYQRALGWITISGAGVDRDRGGVVTPGHLWVMTIRERVPRGDTTISFV